MSVKDESERACLKLNIEKTKVMASGPFRSDQISAQSCLTLCDPMNHSTVGLLVHHHLSRSLLKQGEKCENSDRFPLLGL